jgi:ribosomal protein S18 acetylase RimI-like enzyme
MRGDLFPHVMGAVFTCIELVDVFKMYGVTEYLSATGLSVSKEYRGQNIGAEILRAR